MVLYKVRVNPIVEIHGSFPVLAQDAKGAVEVARVTYPQIQAISIRGIANQDIKLIHISYQ